VNDDKPPEESAPIPPRTVGGLSWMIAVLTGLVLVCILAFWAIGTQKPSGGNAAMASRIIIATEAAQVR
jgi:hypothetical protein